MTSNSTTEKEVQSSEVAIIERSTELQRIAATPIVSQETYDTAAGALLDIKALLKQIDSTFDPSIEAAHSAHKIAIGAKKKYTDPLKEIDQAIRKATSAWVTEQERARQEEERRRREEAEKKAAKEKARQAEEAAALAAIGADPAPVAESDPVVIERVPEVDRGGIGFVDVWKFEITDPTLIPREYLVIDEKKIGQVVRSLKDTAQIPGVRIYSEKSARV
jgi:hypothetical protein